MWGQIISVVLILMGAFPVVALVYSFVRTAGGSRYDTAFYEKDRCVDPDAVVKRRYRGAGHLFYRFFDTMRYSYPQLRVYMLRALSPAFREKIMITTALANSCAQWLGAHKRFGRIAGLSREDIEALMDLDKNRFDDREWVALRWVRTYLECEGVFPDPELNKEFERLFSLQERTCIFAIFKLMLFFNMLANTTRKPYTEGTACAIKPAAAEKRDSGV